MMPQPHCNVQSAWKSGNYIMLIESVFKLSAPVIFMWVTGFYAFFHVGLNLLSELLRFGDRHFYAAWWNCSCLGDFWK